MEDDTEWVYMDLDGQLQGPFTTETMREWWANDLMDADLFVSRVLPNGDNSPFEEIQKLFIDPETAFLEVNMDLIDELSSSRGEEVSDNIGEDANFAVQVLAEGESDLKIRLKEADDMLEEVMLAMESEMNRRQEAEEELSQVA